MKKSPGQKSHTKPRIFTDDLKKKWVEPIREKNYPSIEKKRGK